MNFYDQAEEHTVTYAHLQRTPEEEKLLKEDAGKTNRDLFDESGSPRITRHSDDKNEKLRDLLYRYLSGGHFWRAHRLLVKYRPVESSTKFDRMIDMIVMHCIVMLDVFTAHDVRGREIMRDGVKMFTHDPDIDDYEAAITRLTEGEFNPAALICARYGEGSLESQAYEIIRIVRRNNDIRLSRGSAYLEESVCTDELLKDAASRALQHRQIDCNFG